MPHAISLPQPEAGALYECVPNFSCTQEDGVFPRLRQAAESTGVQVLDAHSDRAYNRTVLTFLGSPAQTERASLQLIEVATQCIDMSIHRGAHPRLGAIDVFPFVPLLGASESQCIKDVQRLAQTVARELDLCVYLYGQAALRPERRELASVRRGQFEGWYREIGHASARDPDFGPATARRCGPVVLGVRPILIAINFILQDADLELARSISRVIRSSSQGLPALQARGFRLGNQVHVSCNILDYRITSPRRVFARIGLLCREAGSAVQETEIVGMIPRVALPRVDRVAMQVKDWRDAKYLDCWLPAPIQI